MDQLPLQELSDRVRPQDDLWLHVNERWLATDPIPADRARWGLSDEKRARVAEQLREIVTTASLDADLLEERLVARLHALAQDGARREQVGLRPLHDELEPLSAASDLDGLLRLLGERQREGVTGPFQVSLLPDDADPTRWAVHLFQAGLTLPVPGLYDRLGDALAEHAERLCAAAGLGAEVAGSALDLERVIAAASWPRPYGDDDRALTNPLSWQQLSELMGVGLAPYLAGLGLDVDQVTLNLCQPSYAEGLGRLLRERPVEQWRDYLTWRVLAARAPYLPGAVAEEHARFHEQVVAGQPEPTPAWRRQVQAVQAALPMALARVWVERHVEPRRREATSSMMETLRVRMRRTLGECDWLGEDARAQAVAKLDAVVLMAGWPDEWPSVDEVDLGDDLCTAARACARHEHDRAISVGRGLVDRTLWGPPPFVVNTFYHPFYNQVTVEGASLPPAAVLDDPAVLHGQYASIVGHELGHAFDSRGSQRDALGRVRTWWTPAEESEFRRRAEVVERQAHGYQPRGVDDVGVDGALVGFECVAELIGLQLAWDAYCDSTTPEERARREDGVSQAERFWLAKAYGRRATDRPQTARNRLAGDVHPPFEVFANLARNVDGFHETFGTRPGDGMWLAPEERVRIF